MKYLSKNLFRFVNDGIIDFVFLYDRFLSIFLHNGSFLYIQFYFEFSKLSMGLSSYRTHFLLKTSFDF